jgi:hypothetical protein
MSCKKLRNKLNEGGSVQLGAKRSEAHYRLVVSREYRARLLSRSSYMRRSFLIGIKKAAMNIVIAAFILFATFPKFSGASAKPDYCGAYSKEE